MNNPGRQIGVPAFQHTFTNRPEAKTDIHGRDEAWWKGQMHAKGKELKEAVEDYEWAHEEYMKKAGSLNASGITGLSLTQYQWMALRLAGLNDEMAKQQARMTEINESIKKLIKEAEESGANPERFRE